MLLNVVRSGSHIMLFCTWVSYDALPGGHLIFLGSSCLQVADWYKLLLPYWSMHNAHLLLQKLPQHAVQSAGDFPPLNLQDSSIVRMKKNGSGWFFCFGCTQVSIWVPILFSWLVHLKIRLFSSIAYGLYNCIHLGCQFVCGLPLTMYLL